MTKKTTRKKATRKKAAKKGSGSVSGNSPKRSEATAAGRPAGSQNITRPSTETELSRCLKCGSTDRISVGQPPLVQEFRGIHHGKVYSHIVRRRVRCKNCGQHRIDITREHRPEKKK